MNKLVSFLVILILSACGKPGVGAAGAKGDSGGVGVQGETGATGDRGLVGITGATGNYGTSITPIQFCPSTFIPSYPSVFPEYGICMGGQMFGVYSANGGFWTLLPPGRYSSDGINASCTFTIGSNCAVTQ